MFILDRSIVDIKRRGYMIFTVEYEIPPLRAIYHSNVSGKDSEMAERVFKTNNPKAKIRNVKLYEKQGG
jgi:hypothetical protein